MSSVNKLDNQSLMENPNHENSIHKEVQELYNDFCNFTGLMKIHTFVDLLKENLNISAEWNILRFDENEIFYRARIITDKDIEDRVIGTSKLFKGFDKKNSFVPPENKCQAGRLNFEHNPFLYVANNIHTAILEVRPQLREPVSVAKILSKSKLQLLNLTEKYDTKNQNTYREALIELLSTKLSLPHYKNVENEYLPLEIIADVVRFMGYDGIAYRSAMDNDGINYCIFNYEDCTPILSDIYTPRKIEIRCQKNNYLQWIQGKCMENGEKYCLNQLLTDHAGK